MSVSRPVRAEATDGVSFETDAPRNDSKNLRGPGRKTKRRRRQENREVRDRKIERCGSSLLEGDYRRTLVPNCRSKEVPSRPLSEEHDEEVAVHELHHEAVVFDVEDESVCRT